MGLKKGSYKDKNVPHCGQSVQSGTYCPLTEKGGSDIPSTYSIVLKSFSGTVTPFNLENVDKLKENLVALLCILAVFWPDLGPHVSLQIKSMMKYFYPGGSGLF